MTNPVINTDRDIATHGETVQVTFEPPPGDVTVTFTTDGEDIVWTHHFGEGDNPPEWEWPVPEGALTCLIVDDAGVSEAKAVTITGG